MKVLLVSPKAKENEAMKNGGGFRIAQMSLGQVAACLPPDAEIQLADELIAPAPLDTDADLIGITVMTEVVERAYELGDEYRRRGKTVIMGGIHPTLLPLEAKLHCDAVVAGEAEGQIDRLVDDWRRGQLRPIYQNLAPVDLAGLPWPRRDLFDRRHYQTVNCLQLSRGCPNRCSFCVVPVIHGHRYRIRPLDDVLAEIDSLQSKEIFFVDDNFAADKKYAKEFCRRLATRDKLICGQLSAATLNDGEMLGWLRKAGAVGFFVGFESISQATLDAVGKRSKATDYRDGIKRMHDNGMTMIGAFVFGLDTDGPDVFERTIEFVDSSEIDIVQFTLLVPFPGTPIYQQLKDENRLTHPAWWLESAWNLVPYQPLHFTREELRSQWIRALTEVYRLPKAFKRTAWQLPGRPWLTSWITLKLNLAYRAGLSF